MSRALLMLFSGLIAVSLAACGNSPSASTSPSAAAKTTPSPLTACAVLNAQDASQLAGVTFGPGQGTAQTCTYMSGNTVVTLTVIKAANTAAVQAALQQQQATLGAAGFTQIQLSGADTAYEFLQSGGGITISAIEVIHGTTFFVIESLGSVTTDTTLRAAATTVLSRLS